MREYSIRSSQLRNLKNSLFLKEIIAKESLILKRRNSNVISIYRTKQSIFHSE